MDWMSALFMGGAMLGGAALTSNANKKAAQLGREGQRENVAAIREGNQLATQRLDQLTTEARPGLDYLRTLVANPPQTLTPSQSLQLEDTRREAANVVAGTPMRGSGRATTAIIRKVEADAKGNMYDQNLRRADDAARLLSGYGANATTQAAGVDQSTGQAIGRGAIDTATTSANATTSTAASNASTMGAIASIFANDAKERAREARYKEAMTGV